MGYSNNKFNREVQITDEKWYLLTYIYIYSSIFVFVLGWIKCSIAIIVCIAICLSIWNGLNRPKLQEIPKLLHHKKKAVSIKLPILLLVVLVVLIMGYYLGWGGFVPQTGDWYKHNMIMKDLVTKSWPVFYENGNEHSMLTYYIAQYMVPALIGKVFKKNVEIAYIVQYLWLVMGAILIYLGIIRVLKVKQTRKQIFTLLVMFFFGSLLIVGQFILWMIEPQNVSLGMNHWLCFDFLKIQYSNNLVSLRWVYPQCIVPWLMSIVLFERWDDIANYAILFLPMLIYATLPALGIFVFLAICILAKMIANKNIIKVLKECFSIQNILMIISLGSVLLIYLSGNVFQEKVKEMSLQVINYNGRWEIYFVFVIFTYGIDAFLIRKINKNRALYHGIVFQIVLLPFFTMGKYNDFTMRVSISALFVLMLMMLQMIFEDNSKKLKYALMICLCVGAVFPIKELVEAVKLDDINNLAQSADNGINSLEYYANRSFVDTQDIDDEGLIYNYYTYDIEDSLFNRVLAKNSFQEIQLINSRRKYSDAVQNGVLLYGADDISVYYLENEIICVSSSENVLNECRLQIEYEQIIKNEKEKNKEIFDDIIVKTYELPKKEVKTVKLTMNNNKEIELCNELHPIEFSDDWIECSGFNDTNWISGILRDGGMLIYPEFDQRLFSLKNKKIVFDNGEYANVCNVFVMEEGSILVQFEKVVDISRFTHRGFSFRIE